MGQTNSRQLLGDWAKSEEEINGLRILIWKHPSNGLELRVELTVHRDWPVVEWVAFLRNTGNATSPRLQRLLPADLSFEGENFVLHGIRGDTTSDRSYEPYTWDPQPGTQISFGGREGKPTAGLGGWPYFNLAGPGPSGFIDRRNRPCRRRV
jgi:hypothetical protein